jgi:excisionase family DNA binding protein
VFGPLDLLRQLISPQTEAVRFKLFLTVREAALYSGLPRTTIRRLIRENVLPAAKAGGWRIKRKYLEQLELRHLRALERE